ncbi:hypothetical protein DPF_2517 [Desulfoplanes formicivorans]|uniref:Uncharacterized protein n=1 Tax=Desulfoplanes formicivorans TaxID=1592317 RepID=A0A194AMB6_9BACT|nr:hypothetical protein DPF_2517 [Desulfoplanes formicivorans]
MQADSTVTMPETKDLCNRCSQTKRNTFQYLVWGEGGRKCWDGEADTRENPCNASGSFFPCGSWRVGPGPVGHQMGLTRGLS